MKPLKIKIKVQGRPQINNGFVYKEGEEIALLSIDARTKRGEVCCHLYEDDIPGISIIPVEESLHLKEDAKSEYTDFYFPEFKGWKVCMAEYCRYTISVCLIKEEE